VLVQEHNIDPPSTNPSVPVPQWESGWSTTFIRRPAAGEVAPLISISVNDITNGDPYLGDPGLLTLPEVVMGPFAGKLDDTTSGSLRFVARLNGTQRVSIYTNTTTAEIETVANGLVLRSNGFDVNGLPGDFERIDEGSNARRPYVTEWSVSYAREQLSKSQVTVHARSEPGYSALINMGNPGNPRIVEVNDFEGVLSPRGLVFDVSPGFQIEVTRDAADSPVTDEELMRLAVSVVGITTEQFAELKATAAENPLIATDMPCNFYLRGDAQSDDPSATDEGGYLTVPPGATITVDLSTSQPLANVRIWVGSASFTGTPPGQDLGAVITTLDELTDSASVDLTWDGILKGAPARPGNYSISVTAERADPSDTTQCSAGSSDTMPIRAYFKVP